MNAGSAHLPWRTGRKVGRTIYAQQGPEPSDSDPLIGVMDTPELAALAVAARNGHDDPVQQLRNIADHVIGGNNPNLADVLLEFADCLERDMAGSERPQPELVLVRLDDLRETLKAALNREAPAYGRLAEAVTKASQP
jgi:hypothetical protein